jgi:oligogalacturonide transport system substrate-binding protein
MRRPGIALVVLLVMTLCLVGSLAAQTPVTLRFSWWGGDARHNATLEAIKLYQTLNPHVTIKPEYGGADGYLDKKKVELASKTAPDVMQIDYTWMEELISKGDFFVDLSTRKEIDTSTFGKPFLDRFCVFGGKLLGLPTGSNAQMLIVNKTAADKYGVDLKQLAYWDGILSEGKKLHAKDKNAYLLHYDTASFAGEVLASMLQQMTGKLTFDAQNKQNYGVRELTTMYHWLAEAVKGGVLQPPGEAAIYSMKGEQNPKWINGQIIALVDWASNYQRYIMKDTEYVFLLPPNVRDAKSGSSDMRPSQELCINAASPNIAEAAKFLNWFLNSPEAAVVLGDVRSVPVSSSARDAAAKAGKINPKIAEALGRATTSIKKSESGYAINREVVQIFLDIANKVAFGVLTPAKAAEEQYRLTEQKVAELVKASKK